MAEVGAEGDPHVDVGAQIDELLPTHHGVFQVETEQSTHIFDMIDHRVKRIPREFVGYFVNDTWLYLRTLEACCVGAEGVWTMHPLRRKHDFFWHQSTLILSITRIE